MSAPEGLPAELGRLLEAERTAPSPPAAVRAAVRAKLAATIGVGPLGGAAAAASLGGAGKVLATIAIVAGVGGGTAVVVHAVTAAPNRPVGAHVEPVARSLHAPIPPAPRTSPPPAIRPSAPPDPVQPRIPALPRAHPHPPAEAALLRAAWQALAAGDAPRALELADQDRRANPAGTLAEEREALRVVALARRGRGSEAASLARAFLEAHPNSVYRDLVTRAIAGTTPEAP